MKKIIIITTAFLLSACASTTTVKGSKDSESINTAFMTCSSHYEFSRDCSIWTGATRTVEIDSFEVNVGATADGKTILVMDADLFKNTVKGLTNPFILNSPAHSEASNNSYQAIKKVLDNSNISINKTIPLKSFGNIDGYVLELNNDGYTSIISYTQK